MKDKKQNEIIIDVLFIFHIISITQLKIKYLLN